MSLTEQKLFHNLLKQTFNKLGAGALSVPNGPSLWIQPENLYDLSTLPESAQTVFQYLKLQPEQMAILNDPYSGGSLLSEITLVLGLSIGGNKTDLLLSSRYPLRPRIRLTRDINEEGLRIPPTPIGEKGILKQDLVDIISAAPLAPKDFKLRLEEEAKKLFSIGERLKRILSSQQVLSKTFFEGYLTNIEKVFLKQIEELPVGDVALQFPEPEKLQLRLEITPHHLKFDFTGTGNSNRYALTHSATSGACLGAFLAFMDWKLPIVSNLLNNVEVIAPTQSWLNARPGSAIQAGYTTGVDYVASAVVKALSQLAPQKGVGMSALSIPGFEIEFETGQHFFDHLEAGAGAHSQGPGSSATRLWRLSRLQPSIEEIETRFPLRIKQSQYRTQSGGKGKHHGGDGLARIYEVLAAGVFRWRVPHSRVEGFKSGNAGVSSSLEIHRGEQVIPLAIEGEMSLQPGDAIYALSGSGGGYGLKSEDEGF